jgi:hypothetical protein
MIINRVYTDKEQDAIIQRCDPDIIIELVEEQMIPEDLEFNEFLRRYTLKHMDKYNEDFNLCD